MTFDFHTADNATPPHVKVFIVETDRTVCTIPIENGDTSEAESFAEIILEAFRHA